MDLIKIIKEHNLSIRRFPDKDVSVHEMRHFKEGDEIIEWGPRKIKMCRHTTIPKHAGWYMVQQINNTGNIVFWKDSIDTLAPTLEESINLFLTHNDCAYGIEHDGTWVG
jgi:hypothetical protein